MGPGASNSTSKLPSLMDLLSMVAIRFSKRECKQIIILIKPKYCCVS